MARKRPSQKATPPASEQSDDMLVVRGPKDVKQPTPKEIQAMKNREFMRKHPHTSA